MLRPLISAFVAALLATSLSAGLVGGVMPASASAAPADSAIELNTDLTLIIARCEGCVITLFSSDGYDAGYTSLPQAVVDGSVTITLPSARTAGMSVRVDAPWAAAESYDAFVVWRYAGTAIGDRVSLTSARSKRRASGCWAGTVNEAVTLTIKVRHVSFRGLPGAIAWTPDTESFVRPMERIRHGVLASSDGLFCSPSG